MGKFQEVIKRLMIGSTDFPGNTITESGVVFMQIESQSQRSLPKRNARPKKSLATVLEDSDGERLEDEDPIEDDSDFGW